MHLAESDLAQSQTRLKNEYLEGLYLQAERSSERYLVQPQEVEHFTLNETYSRFWDSLLYRNPCSLISTLL